MSRIGHGYRADEQLSVGVLWLFDYALYIATLGDRSAIKGDDVLGNLICGGQVVGDIDQ